MGHIIQMVSCKKGHSNFSISFDSNECGCHHNGDPCLIINCRDCVRESIENDVEMPEKIEIPINQHTIKELNKRRNLKVSRTEGDSK